MTTQLPPLARRVPLGLACAILSAFPIASAAAGDDPDPNDPGILEPVLSALSGQEVRIPNTDQASGGQLLNLVGAIGRQNARGATSLTGHVIGQVSSPNRDLRDALDELAGAASDGDAGAMQAWAAELESILMGTTQGRIYDGFAMLNFNRGAFAPDHLPGEYKTKKLIDSGETTIGIDGQARRIWEVNVNHFWYDGQFDSDTFLLRVPVEAHAFDQLRVHFRIYSLVKEDFAPTVVLLDHRDAGSVQFPFKGLDAVWTDVDNDSVTDITVDFPSLRLVRGIYTWGWREHPPRIQFLQPVFEMVNAHTGAVELEPQGKSFADRNRMLSLADIGDAAPEKKMLQVVQAVLAGASPAQVLQMLTDDQTSPRGTWQDWADFAEDQLQIPVEAWDLLAPEGVTPNDFGPYRHVTVYMNNEMYGTGPKGNDIEGWRQRDSFQVKLINLDNHTHYFRNVDFGPKLHDDIATEGFSSGSHSFEIMNFKPTYGAPKVAEVQWRAGWGFRPHLDVLQQSDVFPRNSERFGLVPLFDGEGRVHFGWQFSESVRGGDFRFDPPPFIIGSVDHPSTQRLTEPDGSSGLLIGRHTPGYGVARMCSHDDHPFGGFCEEDISAFNPHGAKNIDLDGDGVNDVLWFPPFLRNPDPDTGGDIIPPTTAWKPFLWINPANGTLWIDPADPGQGAWADGTYSHGTPVPPGGGLTADIECLRSAGQVFYQFDDLYHDNAIFSPHPTFEPTDGPSNYCGPAVPNSTGDSAEVRAVGHLAASENQLWLAASSLPAGEFGYFIASQTPGFVPGPGGSAGNLCLGGNIGRFRAQVASSGPHGQLLIEVDLTSIPTSPPQTVLPGQTWNFQAWFRDGMTSNFTDAVAVTFE